MKLLQEILQETKKKSDVKWIAKLKDGKTKTIWASTRYDAEQKLGTSILIQGGYTIKKALTEGKVGPTPVDKEEIIRALKPFANQRVIWRGMNGSGKMTMYSKMNNERSGFYGGLDALASSIVEKLGIKNPAFGTLKYGMALQFGDPKVMIPIKPYRAFQSETITDLLHARGDGPGAIESYKERMDLDGSEIVFDIKEYYMVSPYYALKQVIDPDDFSENRLHKSIQTAIEGIKTYQDVIDLLTKSSENKIYRK